MPKRGIAKPYVASPERDKAEGITHYHGICLAPFEATGEFYEDGAAKYRCTGCGQICQLSHDADYPARLRALGFTKGPKMFTPANDVEVLANLLTAAVTSCEHAENGKYGQVPKWASSRRRAANDAIGKAKATHQAALSRAETAEAMVEAAIENMAGASCIPDDDSPCMSPEYVRTEPDGIELPGSPPLEICRKYCSDHLSAKAKEALKS